MFYVFMLIWFLFVGHFMYVFYKKEFDIPDTLNWYKDLYRAFNKVKNLLKEKVSEDMKSNFSEIKEIVKEDLIKNKQELIDKEELKKKEDLINIDSTNCKKPEGFPINLCLSSALNKEEVLVREKIFKKIKTEPAFYHEGGQKKMILPLEALIFLNKGLNPLVNEQGEIILSIKEDQFLEDLKKIIMYLKATDNEILYQSDEEVLDAIKVLAMLASENNLTLQQLAEITKNKLALKIEEQGLNMKIESSDTEIKISKKNIEAEEFEVISSKGLQISMDKIIEGQNSKELPIFTTEVAMPIASLPTVNSEFIKSEKSIETKTQNESQQEIKSNKKDNFKDIKEDTKKEFFGVLETINEGNMATGEARNTKHGNEVTGEATLVAKTSGVATTAKQPSGDEAQSAKLGVDSNLKNEYSAITTLDTDSVFPNISIEELMEQELRELKNEVIEEKSENNIYEFLHNLAWREGSRLEKSQEKEGFENNITSNISEFIQNISKQKILVFNDNKTNVFIDRKLLIVAYAKLFGIGYQSTLNFIERMLRAKPELFNQNFNQAIIDSLGEYVSDLVFGKKTFGISYFTENNESYQGYGIWVDTEMFRKCLTDEEYDFFRSFPYNSNIKVGISAKKQADLIKDFSDTEI